jgi:hypothetical protein
MKDWTELVDEACAVLRLQDAEGFAPMIHWLLASKASPPNGIPPQEVSIMCLSPETIRLAYRYMAIVDRYETPGGYAESGYTPYEQELIRTKAHNELIRALSADGVDVRQRISTTELAGRIVSWLRD